MTKLLYLQNTNLFEANAHVTDVRTLEDGRLAVLLDETIFYPQGGGQPCDNGLIRTDSVTFHVSDVRMDKDGNVLHIGSFEKGVFAINDSAKLLIDSVRRIKNTKAHSAGHLIDCAISSIGINLHPTKGYHFPEGPYVEYMGELDISQDMVDRIQKAVDDLVVKNNKIIPSEVSAEEAEKRGLFVPPGKKARVVKFEGFEECGCGGTHVDSAGEIGKIVIRKIKSKNNIVRICYEVM